MVGKSASHNGGRFARTTRPLALLGATVGAALLLAACGGSGSACPPAHVAAASSTNGLYGSLPPAGTQRKGGTVTMGFLTGSTPTYIFPILPAANASVYDSYEFQNNMYLPLYGSPVGGTPTINYALSLAPAPVFSDGNKTLTIHMKPGFKWSNGQPVDANDLIFDIDLIKQAIKESPSNWNSYTPGLFPDNLASITASGKFTVVMHPKRAYNPSYFVNDQLQGNIYALPSTAWNIASAGGTHLDFTVPANAKKIYDFLGKAGGQVASFGTNPLWKVADGPFVIGSFSATNGSFTLDANPRYGGSPKPRIAHFDGVAYTGLTPQLNALRTGDLDIALLDSSQLGAVGSLRGSGYSVFGYPNFGFLSAFYNFKDKTNHFNSVISQLYVRQALAHLEDQAAYLRGVYKNAGALAYGPVPSVPPTPFTPANAVKTPYPYNPAAAVSLLRSHGWRVVPNGQTTCAKAGTGAGECGAGIPQGTPFTFTWFYIPASTTIAPSLESEAFASAAKQYAGINVKLQLKSFNYLIANFNDANPADAKYTNAWGVVDFGGFTDSLYPTTDSVFNTGGVYNQGAYSNATADSLINKSVFSSDPTAVKNEASFLTANPPGIFFPNPDLIYAVSKKVGGLPSSFLALTQYTPYPQYWYLTK